MGENAGSWIFLRVSGLNHKRNQMSEKEKEKNMLGSLKEKLGLSKQRGEVLKAPLTGKTIAMSKVSDPTFGQEILGKGIAIIPSAGKLVAPIDGTVEMVFDTKHASSMSSHNGMQILIHVGLDTVTLKGEPFTAHVSGGQKVKEGDLLLEFDIKAIQSAGLETVTPIVICNSNDYNQIDANAGQNVNLGDEILTAIK